MTTLFAHTFKSKNTFVLTTVLLLWNQAIIGQEFGDYTQEINDELINIDLVAVPGGTFTMGAAEDDGSRKSEEKPPHEVRIDSLWMGKYEITWAQFDAFVYGNFSDDQFQDQTTLSNLGIDGVSGATMPYEDMSIGMGKDNFPAVNMTQYAAIMYCKWLSAKTGVFYRIPTEAEWEYVCKQGKTDEFETLDSIAVYNSNSDKKYLETGSKKPNALGIHDMLGNVSEWVLDQYDAAYYETSLTDNPWNKPTELYPRVLRGGSWKDMLYCQAKIAD